MNSRKYTLYAAALGLALGIAVAPGAYAEGTDAEPAVRVTASSASESSEPAASASEDKEAAPASESREPEKSDESASGAASEEETVSENGETAAQSAPTPEAQPVETEAPAAEEARPDSTEMKPAASTPKAYVSGLRFEQGHYRFYVNGSRLRNQWKSVNGKTYYFDGNGNGAVGMAKIGNYYYLFNEKAQQVKVTDAEYKAYNAVNYQGKWFTMTGGNVIRLGFYHLNGNTYFATLSRGIYTGGWHGINGKVYYFQSADNPGDVRYGAALSGLQETKKGVWNYFDAKTKVLYKDHWFTVDSETYYSDKNGTLARGISKINGRYYCFNDDDNAPYQLKGPKVTLQGSEKTFHLTKGNELRLGLYQVNGHRYFADLAEGIHVRELRKIGNLKYYFTKTGEAASGLYLFREGVAYFSPYTNAGQRNVWVTGVIYFDSIDKAFNTGLLRTFYIGPDGIAVKGFRQFGKDTHYFDENGVQCRNNVFRIDGKSYAFNKYGVMQKGLRRLNGYLYYGDPRTGALVSNEWKVLDGKTYYFMNNFRAAAGLLKYDNDYYFFDLETNVQFKGGWAHENGYTYYINAEGVALRGTHVINGKTYRFHDKYCYLMN